MDGEERPYQRPSNLVSWRLNELERRYLSLEDRVEKLATKEDLEKIEKKLDVAAEKKDDRQAEWTKTVVGGTLSGVVVGIVLMVAQAMAQGKVHIP